MKLNRLVVLGTVAVLTGATLLSGCATGGGDADSGTDTPTIAFVPGGLNDNFWITLGCGVEAAAKEAGAEVTTQAPQDGTATQQKPIIDSFIASKPDVLIVSATDSTAMQSSIKAASDAGIKVVFVNNGTVDSSFAVSSVLTDDVAGGRAGFEAIKQLNPDGGKVLVIGSLPGVENTDKRVQGFEEAVKTESAFNYLGMQYSNNDATTAAELVAAALQKDPDIIGIFAVGQIAAEGSAAGLKQVGKQGSVTLVGYDAGPNQIAELKDNTVQALIAQQPEKMGELGVQLGLDALAGKDVEQLVNTSVTIITRENVDTDGASAAYRGSC